MGASCGGVEEGSSKSCVGVFWLGGVIVCEVVGIDSAIACVGILEEVLVDATVCVFVMFGRVS